MKGGLSEAKGLELDFRISKADVGRGRGEIESWRIRSANPVCSIYNWLAKAWFTEYYMATNAI